LPRQIRSIAGAPRPQRLTEKVEKTGLRRFPAMARREVTVNIYVCVKQVPDTETSISLREGNSVNETNIKWIVNPYDEYAIEEALKLKEKNPGSTVCAIALGPERTQTALRSALAMGIDKVIHIETSEVLDDRNTGRALAGAIRMDDDFGIIFTGKQAIDNDAYQVHIHLAEYLSIPVATNVISFVCDPHGGIVTVEREIDEGAREVIEMAVPCVVAATKGLNAPRYASVIGIMKAKKMEIKKLSLADVGVDPKENEVSLLKLSVPAEKPQGKIIEGDPQVAVRELIRRLKEEAKVI
jgi:electron transfer flavoprotein beta subunit